jgi:hypothetical protein
VKEKIPAESLECKLSLAVAAYHDHISKKQDWENAMWAAFFLWEAMMNLQSATPEEWEKAKEVLNETVGVYASRSDWVKPIELLGVKWNLE